jgi:outer membrane lipoprotein-sorting protein
MPPFIKEFTMKKITLFFIILCALFPIFVPAQDSITGREIMEHVYYRSEGDDRTSELTMTLTNARGDERIRRIIQYSLETGAMEKSIMFFQFPADVKDTSFMSWSYDEAGRDDDQWIYLPALKKVKRISSDSKSDYFMGSDFTYDDLGDRHPANDTHKVMRTENVDGEDCFVIESLPKEEEYQYSRTVSWVIKDKWIVLKKEFYDEDGDFLKSLLVNRYENIEGFWIILHSRMVNQQSGHSTDMELKNVQLNSGISDRLFSERYMKRGIK